MRIYGLASCDSTKAASKWLKQQGASFSFHDFKQQPVSKEILSRWLSKVPLEKLLNKKSTTWRGLTEQEKQQADTTEGAMSLMQAHSNLIKRPVVEWKNNKITVGFSEADFNKTLLENKED